MTNKEEALATLKEEGVDETLINDILDAKNWDEETKYKFVSFVSGALNFLSSQPIKDDKTNKIIRIFKAYYNLYLEVLFGR